MKPPPRFYIPAFEEPPEDHRAPLTLRRVTQAIGTFFAFVVFCAVLGGITFYLAGGGS